MVRHPSYQHITNKTLIYEAFKWEQTLSFVISSCKILIYLLAYYIPLVLLLNIYKNILIVFIPLAFVPFVILYRRIRWIRNPFFPNKIEQFFEKNIRRYFATPNGNALCKVDFKLIKKQNPNLYLEITSDYCLGLCYLYAREIALLFPDAKLVYCAITDPFEQNDVFAHAFLERNGEIYDTNRRMSYKIKDYEEIFKVKIYKKWIYTEFCKDTFREEVKEDFVRWCQENNVKNYHMF